MAWLHTPKLVLVVLLLFCCCWPRAFLWANSDMIGAERCGSCHQEEWQIWLHGPHGPSLQRLTAEQLADPSCQQCHQTPAAPPGSQAGVQCESCHGPGKWYQPAFVMKDRELARLLGLVDVAAARCQQCHTGSSPSLLPFDFARAWSRIRHGKTDKPAIDATITGQRAVEARKRTAS